MITGIFFGAGATTILRSRTTPALLPSSVIEAGSSFPRRARTPFAPFFAAGPRLRPAPAGEGERPAAGPRRPGGPPRPCGCACWAAAPDKRPLPRRRLVPGAPSSDAKAADEAGPANPGLLLPVLVRPRPPRPRDRGALLPGSFGSPS